MVMDKRKGFINKGKKMEKDGQIVTHHLPPTKDVACHHATCNHIPYINQDLRTHIG